MDPATQPAPPAQDRPPAPQPLTDQALLAVHMGRALAGGGRATVAHLVAGLAGEPDGLAGAALRRRYGDTAARIALHDAVEAAALPDLETAFVALPVVDRPCWTLELLAAARRVGSDDLAHLLDESGLVIEQSSAPPDELIPHLPDPDDDGPAAETFGRYSLRERGFTDAADLAVARTRAAGGDSRTLLAWLGTDAETQAALRPLPGVHVTAVLDRARTAGPPVGPQELVTAVVHLTLRQVASGA